MVSAWHFLEAHGLYASIIGAAVAIPVAFIAAKLVGLLRWGRAHFALLVRIMELLDTERPGGLTAIVEALREDKR